MKNILSRFVSLVLVCVMCVGMLPVEVFAQEYGISTQSTIIAPEISYNTVDRETAHVEYTHRGEDSNTHLIFVIDQSIDNETAAVGITDVMNKNYGIWGSSAGVTANVIYYNQVVTSGGWGSNYKVNCQGQANAPLALDKAMSLLDDVKPEKVPVIVWVLSPEDKLAASQYLAKTKTKFAELQTKVSTLGGEIITYQVGNSASDWIVGSNVHAYSVDSASFNESVTSCLEKVCLDYIQDLRIDFSSCSSLITGVSNVSVSGADIDVDIDSFIATIPKLYDYEDFSIRFDLSLDIDLYIKEVAGTVSTSGKHISGLFDDINTSDVPELGDVTIDRTRRAAIFNWPLDGVMKIEEMPSKFYAVPEVSDLDTDDRSFGGWVVRDGEEAYYMPGDIHVMPEDGVVLDAVYGGVAVDLILGDVIEPPEMGNKMYGPWSDGDTAMFDSVYSLLGGSIARNVVSVSVLDEDVSGFSGCNFKDRLAYKGGIDGGKVNAWYIGRDHYNPVIMYISNNQSDTSKYDLYLVGKGGVSVSYSAMGLFRSLSSVASFDLELLNISNVRNMSSMFSGCSSVTMLDLGDWDVSSVTDMTNMFSSCSKLHDLDVSAWCVDNVTGMSGMFQGCSELESLDVSNWNTHNVTSMRNMFLNCYKLLRLSVQSWNVGNVTDFGYMLSRCYKLEEFDPYLWDTHSLTNTEAMFYNCYGLTGLDLSGWDMSRVVDMTGVLSETGGWFTNTYTAGMFYGCNGLTILDVSGWDVSSAKDMQNTFTGCSKLSGDDVAGLDVSDWKLGKDTNPYGLFTSSWLKEADLSGWDTTDAESLKGIFYSCTALTSVDMSNLDMSGIKDMSYMLYECSRLVDIGSTSQWNMGSVVTTNNMFFKCGSLRDLDVSTWNMGSCEDMQHMFDMCSSLIVLDVSGWNVSNVKKMGSLFCRCSGLTELDVSNWDVSNVVDMSDNTTFSVSMWGANSDYTGVFYGCSGLETLDVSRWDVHNVVDMRGLFSGCTKLRSIPVEHWDVSSVTDMRTAFANCTSLTSIGVDGWKTDSLLYVGGYSSSWSSGSQMYGMFYKCSALEELDLSGWDMSRISDISSMFSGCTNLGVVGVSGWNTSKFQRIGGSHAESGVFSNCKSLVRLDLSTWDTSCVTDVGYAFSSCISLLDVNVSGWDTSKVTNFGSMFRDCKSIVEFQLSLLDLSSATSMAYMFSGCTSLGSFSLCNSEAPVVSSLSRMFDGCVSLIYADFSDFSAVKLSDISYMFNGCTSLSSVDFSNFSSNSLSNMSYVFYGCTALSSVDFSGFVAPAVTNMTYMFSGCTSLELIDVSALSIEKVSNMAYMFYNCSSLKSIDFSDVSGNKTNNVITSISNLFYGCSSLRDVNLSGWVMLNLSSMSGVFYGTGAEDLRLDMSWTISGSTMTISSLLSGKTGKISLELGAYAADDTTYSQKRTIANAFIDWANSSASNSLVITSNGTQIYPDIGQGTLSDTVATEAKTEVTVNFVFSETDSISMTLPAIAGDTLSLSDFEDMDFASAGYEGYELDYCSPNVLSVSDNADDNVITVYYTKTQADQGVVDEEVSDDIQVPSDDVVDDENVDEVAPDASDTPSDIPVEDAGDESIGQEGSVETPSIEDPAPDELSPEDLSALANVTSVIGMNKVLFKPMVGARSTEPRLEAAYAASIYASALYNTGVDNSFASRASDVTNEDIDYETLIPTADNASPVGTKVQYIVRINYVGDDGARSNEISVKYPIPEGVVPVSDNAVEVGAVKNGTGKYCNDDSYLNTAKVVDEFKVSGNETSGYVLTGSITDLPVGKHVDVTVECEIKQRIDSTHVSKPEGDFYTWTGTAYAKTNKQSAVSNPLRLWDGDLRPVDVGQARIIYKFMGSIPDNVTPPDAIIADSVGTVTLSSISAPSGYMFDGWYMKNADGSLSDVKQTSYTVQDIDLGNEVIFVGKWTSTEHLSISYRFEADGTSKVPPTLVGTVVGPTTVEKGTKIAIATPPDVQYYDFVGWHKVTVNGVENNTLPREGELDTSSLNDGDEVVYIGSWTPHEGSIRFDANGASGVVPSDMSIELGDPSGTLPASSLTNMGYTFKGWAEYPDSDDIYASGADISQFVGDGKQLSADGSVLTLYAIWEKIPSFIKVSKGADHVTIKPGESLEYDIFVTNDSNTPATGITVSDVLPAGVNFVSYQIDTGAEVTTKPADDVYNIGTVPANSTITLTIKAVVADTVTAGQRLSNTATVYVPGEPDGIESNESVVEVVDDTAKPRLRGITKTLVSRTPGTIKVGDTVTLTYKITVTGDNGATYVVSDEGADLVSGSLTGTIGAAGKAELTVSKQVVATGGDQKVTNIAYVKPGDANTDPIPATPTNPNYPDKSPEDTSKPDTTNPGPDNPWHPSDPEETDISVASNLKLTGVTKSVVSVTRNGDSVVVEYLVTVRGSAGATYVVSDPDAELVSGNLAGTLGASGESEICFKKTVAMLDTAQQVSNTAYVKPGDAGTDSIAPDATHPNYPDDTPATPDIGSPSVTPDTDKPWHPTDPVVTNVPAKTPPAVGAPALSVNKSVDKPTVNPGDEVIYTIAVSNTGTADATDVKVTDVLDSRLEFVSYKIGNGAVDTTEPAGGVYEIGTLMAGVGTSIVKIKARVKNLSVNAQIGNTAVVSSPDIPDNPAEDDVVITVTVPESKLSVVKTASSNQVKPGEGVSFTITVRNDGDTKLTGVSVKDVLDSRLSFESYQLDGLGVVTVKPVDDTYSVGDIDVGDSVRLVINTVVKAGAAIGQLKNTVVATRDGDTTGETGDVTIEIVTPVKPPVPGDKPSLRVTKTANKSKVNPGDSVVYTIIVTNDGNVSLPNVKVTDVLDSRMVFDSYDLDGVVGTTQPNGGSYTIGTMAVGSISKLTINAHVAENASAGSLRNTAVAEGIGAKNTGDVTIEVVNPVTPTPDPKPNTRPSLRVVKSANKTSAKPGEQVVYTITVTNNGNTRLTGVVVNDVLDSRLVFESYQIGNNVGTTHPNGGSYSIGNMNVGEAVKLYITAHVADDASAGKLKNAVTVNAPGVKVTDDVIIDIVVTDKPTEDGKRPIIGVTKKADRTQVKAGGAIRYTIVVTNSGDSVAENVVVTDVLDSRISLVGWTLNGVGQSGRGSDFAAGSIPAGGRAELVLDTKVSDDAEDGVIKNVAIVGDDSSEVDVTIANDPIIVEEPDVPTTSPLFTITKTVNKKEVLAGSELKYTVVVINNGNEVAKDVTITDELDSLLKFISYSVDGGSVVKTMPQGGVYSVGDIPANGGSVTLVITTKVDEFAQPGTIHNVAMAISPGMLDYVVAEADVEVVAGPPKMGDDDKSVMWLAAGIAAFAGAIVTAILSFGRKKEEDNK